MVYSRNLPGQHDVSDVVSVLLSSIAGEDQTTYNCKTQLHTTPIMTEMWQPLPHSPSTIATSSSRTHAPCRCPLLQIRKSPLLSATLGRRYFLSTATAVQYALQHIAEGQRVAPSNLYNKVMSSISLGNLDEGGRNDI